MAKEFMQTNEAELKAVAKAAGAALKRSGYPVPHSVMLHALASALGERDWHQLKAALTSTPQTQAPVSVQAAKLPSYTPRTWFFLRLAKATGNPVTVLPSTDEAALQAARTAAGDLHNGVLKWGGWNLPATLDLKTSKVDAGDFRPASAKAGELLISLREVGQVSIEVGYRNGDGWFVSTKGVADLQAYLEQRVSVEDVLAAAKPAQLAVPVVQGPVVEASFWTDDRVYEVDFDARPFMMQASDEALAAILEVGFRGDDATDVIATYAEGKGLNETLSEAFDYIGALQKSRMKEPPGFEVSVPPEQYLRWMDEQRPAVLARLLCDRVGVHFVQPPKSEPANRWSWLDDEGNTSDALFQSEQEAALDAYKKLNLLQQAVDGFIF